MSSQFKFRGELTSFMKSESCLHLDCLALVTWGRELVFFMFFWREYDLLSVLQSLWWFYYIIGSFWIGVPLMLSLLSCSCLFLIFLLKWCFYFTDPKRCYSSSSKSAETAGSVTADCLWLLGSKHWSDGYISSRVSSVWKEV